LTLALGTTTYLDGAVGSNDATNRYYTVGARSWNNDKGILVSDKVTGLTGGSKTASECLLFVRAK
jgi:hypothetical protein